MNNLLMVFLAISVLSCASVGKKGRGISSDEFADIENADFEPPKPVSLNISADAFEEIPQVDDVLASESLSRIPEPRLEVLEKSDNPLSKAISRCHRNKEKDGFKLLDEQYRSHRKNASYWNQIGTCYVLENDTKKAILYYNKAISLADKYAPPINNLGAIYQREGKDQKALVAYQKAAKLGRFSFTPMFNMAQLYLKYGLVDKAMPIFKSLHEAVPHDMEVKGALATCHALKGAHQNAISLYQGIDGGYLNHPNIGTGYAVILKQTGQQRKAKRVLNDIDRDKFNNFSRSYYERVKDYISD